MNLLEKLIGTLAPHQCIGCGRDGFLLCEACSLSELDPYPSRCYRCHNVSKQSKVCSKCSRLVALSHVWVASSYNQIVKELVYKLKFNRAVAGATDIAKIIEQVIPDLPKATLVTHVPTANSRVRQRGYDQAKEIAKAISKKRGWVYKELLQRRGKTRQVGSKRLTRIEQLEHAFTLINIARIGGANILLVDDITTTGATIESAAKTLKSAGAKTINSAVFAQA